MRTLLKHGTVYDGTGRPAFTGDVLVEDEHIAEVSPRIECEADRTIDCNGLCVAPGFIDAHSHNDFFIDKDNTEQCFAPFIKQGITTQIVGNCGLSPFGLAEDSPHKDKIGGGIFSAKDPGSFERFVDEAKGRLHVNIAPLVGHGTARVGVNGSTPDPLTKPQMKVMLSHVNEAMEGGAFGGSFGLMYEPSLYAPFDELVAFCREIAHNDGVVTVHPRACSKVALGYRPIFSKPHIELALDEVISIAQAAGADLQYSHFVCVGESTWRCSDHILKKLHANEVPYDIFSFCHGASVITVILPLWYMGLSEQERKSPSVQMRLKLEINVARKLLGIDFDDFTIADIDDEYEQYLGKNIAQIASEEGLSKIDMYIKLVDITNGQARVYIRKYNNDDIVHTLMMDSHSMFMTDSWIEDKGIQTQIAFQGFPYFLVRAKQQGFPLETMVHKMTGKSAKRFGLPRRGELKVGNFADVTVFDYEGVAVDLAAPESTPEGIEYVLINGKTVVDEGVYRPSMCGQMVLKS
ncbi:MAG: amidohydrolase family protein [Coriobacteriia bacterium]|nr:amidohydrolase family protein [Coriobacteriia bacterium]